MKFLAYLATLGLTLAAFGKVETWTNLDGNAIEAELVSADENHVSFRNPDGVGYVYPVAKLSVADQARVREFLARSPAKSAVASPTNPGVPTAPTAQAGKFTSEIADKLVSLKSKTLAPFAREKVVGAKYYAIYFSAHWCPPCRAFTPDLVDAYKSLKSRHPEFELIFVSGDRSKDDMKTYMSEYQMPWPAIRFDAANSLPAVQRYAGGGIPNLVFVTADGEILSSSYVGGKYVGPRKVLKDIREKLSAGS